MVIFNSFLYVYILPSHPGHPGQAAAIAAAAARPCPRHCGQVVQKKQRLCHGSSWRIPAGAAGQENNGTSAAKIEIKPTMSWVSS